MIFHSMYDLLAFMGVWIYKPNGHDYCESLTSSDPLMPLLLINITLSLIKFNSARKFFLKYQYLQGPLSKHLSDIHFSLCIEIISISHYFSTPPGTLITSIKAWPSFPINFSLDLHYLFFLLTWNTKKYF